ncbi:Predicted membrane protein [Chlamydia trachomatis]|nr:Predicted membrane protein [Chlamydia trachomatis]
MFSIKAWALNPNFYISLYDRMDLAEDLSVSKADLNASITLLLDYLDGKASSIDRTMKIAGKEQAVFDAKEKRHMVDVKALYQHALWTGRIAGGIGILLFVLLMHSKNGLAFLTKGLLGASFCFFIFVAFLALWMATDFTDFWIHFHSIFFQNQDWLLTPGKDFMIDMLPEMVFEKLVVSIVLSFLVILIVLNLFCVFYQIRKAPIGFEVEE